MSEKEEPLWWEERFGILEVNPQPENVRVNMRVGQTIELDKLYGPLVVMSIRARVDYDAYEWVIEQAYTVRLPSGDEESRWREVARIPCWNDVEDVSE